MNLFILLIFLTWRLLLFLVSYAGTILYQFKPRFPYSDIFLKPSGLPEWLWTFANFDGVHYLTIAAQRYSAQYTQVFFPVFPLLLSLMQKIFYFLSPLFTALLLSNFLFLAALFAFYKLLQLDYVKAEISWIYLFLLFYPASFYFGSLYTEGLFLLLSLMAFYFARRRMWIASAIAAALASATRFAGIFLLPALLLEWYLETKKNIFRSPLFYIAPLGLLAYMLYLQLNFNDALYFWHAQPVFGAQRSGTGIILLPQVLWRYYKILTTVSLNGLSFWIPLTELLTTLGSIAALLLAHKQKIRLSYLVFSWPALLLPPLTGTLSSMPRYILIIFPVFMALGLLNSKKLKILLLAVFLPLLAVFTVLFTRGNWVA